jgi:hypothetical protein
VAFEENNNVGAGALDISESLVATLVSYDKSLNTFEVKLDDGSMRTVPAHRVTRVRARDRVQAQSSANGQTSTMLETGQQLGLHTTGTGPNVQSKDSSFNSAVHSQWPIMPGEFHESGRVAASPIKPEPRMLGRAQFAAES